MKLKLLFILAFLSLVSCTNKKEILTEEVWILNSRFTSDRSTDESEKIYFERDDSIVTIKFSSFGQVGIKEKTVPKHLSDWNMEEDEIYDDIIISFPDGIIKYAVYQLDENTLSIGELQWPPKKTGVIDTYKRGNSKEWQKDSISRSFMTFYDPEEHGEISFK